MHKRVRSRSGITAVLAMMYLSLFAALSVGFYAATNISSVVSHNEERITDAAIAAESGMGFVRYQLAQVAIPHGTPNDQLFPSVFDQLSSSLNNTLNVGSSGIDLSGDTIRIPAGTGNYIPLDGSGARFRATIQNQGQGLLVTIWANGSDLAVTRVVEMKYNLAQKASAVFDYGVASKGKVTTAGASSIVGATDPTKGSILSTCLTDPQPVVAFGKTISGDISITNPSGDVPYGASTSIGGSTDSATISQHIHKGVSDPAFPTIDTAAFVPYVTNTYVAGSKTLVNCRIPANTNPSFSGNVTIQGVLYIETPNKVTFKGNAAIQGCIVTQNNPTGNISTNTLSFLGNVSVQSVDTLPESFGDLRKLTGAFLLAPDFAVTMSGDFGSVGGSIVSSKMTMSGNATGTVKGSVICLENNPMLISGSAAITIASTGTTNFPAGVFFDSNYVPLMDTYEEVKP